MEWGSRPHTAQRRLLWLNISSGCEDVFCAAFTKVYLADSTGFALPDSLKDTFPGSGGSAAQAGAKIQAVWDDKSSRFDHFALTAWNIPDQKYVDQVVALAQIRYIVYL